MSALPGAILFDLTQRQRLTCSGKEAISFLQNLATNDIKGLAPDHGCEVFLTNHKARVVGHGFVTRSQRAAGDWLLLDAEPAPAVFAHLDRHLISEVLELEDQTTASSQFHLCGPQAKEVLSKVVGRPIPTLTNLQVDWELSGHLPTSTIRKHDWLALPGLDIFLARHRADEVRGQLQEAGAVLGEPGTWEMLRIEAGWPEWGKELDDNRFVVETGRIQQAICYTKGCYLGQEPIVMARDRGHVNRQLLGLRLAGTENPAGLPGARVLLGDQEIGQITSATHSVRLGHVIVLAYLRRGHWTPGLAVVVDAPAGRLHGEVTGLPFVEDGARVG